MKKSILFFSAIVLVASFSFGQPPAGPVKVGDVYGAAVTTENAIPVGELNTQLKGETPVAAKVMGKVTEVCSKKGCWLTVEMPDKSQMFVKMKDYAFFVPLELVGKTVVLDGEAKIKTTSVEELKHYAQDAKKSKEEIAAIKEPKKEVRFMANGIKVVE